MTNNTHAKNRGFLSNERSDKWWIEPLWTGLGFLCFVIYTTWAMFQANNYWWSNGHGGFGGYLSPFYSPLIFVKEAVSGGCLLYTSDAADEG